MTTEPIQSSSSSLPVPETATASDDHAKGPLLSTGPSQPSVDVAKSVLSTTLQQNIPVKPANVIAQIAPVDLGSLGQSVPGGFSPRFYTAGRLLGPVTPSALSFCGGGLPSIHSAASIRHITLSPAASSPQLQRHFSLPAGMMVVPSLGTTRVVSPGSQPLLLHGTNLNELQILQMSPERHQRALVMSQNATGTPLLGGTTIHHLGQGPQSRRSSTNTLLPTNPLHTNNMSGNTQQNSQQQPSQGIVSQLSSQARQQTVSDQTKSGGIRVMSLTSPGQVSQNSKTNRTSPLQSPDRPRKRIKLEEIPAANQEIASKRELICEEKIKHMIQLKERYKEHLTELFFLQNGGNLMDYSSWKKKPTINLLHFLKSGALDSDDDYDETHRKIIEEPVTVPTAVGSIEPLTTVTISTTLPTSVATAQQDQNKRTDCLQGRASQPGPIQSAFQNSQSPGDISNNAITTVSTPGPLASSSNNVSGIVSVKTEFASSPSVNSPSTSVMLTKVKQEGTSTAASGSSGTSTTFSLSSTMSALKAIKSPVSPKLQGNKPQSLSSVYDNDVGSQEAIVERAKQEALVLHRVTELRKEGLWSSRRLPKLQEPPRNKAHWDYLLEEMQWLAADFAQERKWKKAGARKIARMINRHFQELHQKELKAEKEEGMKLKRIASNMAKMVKEFWSNIEKVVQYKQQSRLEEKRKKALDLHLSFIVDQTEKYSSWLTEGLTTHSRAGSISSTTPSGPDDGDFEPGNSGTDDEATIDMEEAEGNQEDGTQQEIDALHRESEMPIEDLLKSLPKEILEKPASVDSDDGDDEASKKGDEEFNSGDENSDDDEQTIDDEENNDPSATNHVEEIKELQDEGEMSMEDLVKKYAGAYDSDFEAELSQTETETESESENETEEEEEAEEEEEDVGIDYLAQNLDVKEHPAETPQKSEPGKPHKDITDIAETAESLQPTGYTLETTQVKTQVPFLLKHTLREYQHVGLNWLATLHERKLNGILADEMGLGKTIQTIAVLAHLACEWGVWGPHLIVVPTSVMLNWELELKKWCPAFKILTYYGNQKERKLKRQGWTKTNAFHVCITSYKLVIQDHQSFRRKKWKYFILDEAQNIKNFKSQRWQTLLNFQSQRRLLLTGTPLQNSLMELWSLMHFLMPHVFQSHREFKEWFANPLSGMIEGSREYNEQLIKRLHKVLRPFLLRRLKQDVEKQMPKKYEHVVMCRLSKRQRFLYDEFMGQTKTKETLASGHFMSVINILMQLRKVCNHPNLFDPRPIVSPLQLEGLVYHTPSLVLEGLRKDPLETIDLAEWHPSFAHMEMTSSAFAGHRINKLKTPRKLIEEIDTLPVKEPRKKLNKPSKPFVFRSFSPVQTSGRFSPFVPISSHSASPTPSKLAGFQSSVGSTPTSVLTPTSMQGCENSAQLLETSPETVMSQGHILQARVTPQSHVSTSQSSVTSASSPVVGSQPITVKIHQTQQGTRYMIPSGSLSQLPAGVIQIVQTSSGQQLIATSSQQACVNGPPVNVSSMMETSTVPSVTRPLPTVTLPSGSNVAISGKPFVKVSPLSTTSASDQTLKSGLTQLVKPTPVVGISLEETKRRPSLRERLMKEKKSVFFKPSLAEKRINQREEKLGYIAETNEKRCNSGPVYGQDLHNAVNVISDTNIAAVSGCPWKSLGYIHCCRAMLCSNWNHPSVYWSQTEALRSLLHKPEDYLAELREILDRFAFVIPPCMAPRIQMHTSHPPPSWLQQEKHREHMFVKHVSPKAFCLHKISTKMTVQFPELRLIEYDCGKLQTLDLLLHRLKRGDHRVLIFTQMTRMLDVLEQFLSYHGHRYLRLDGTTKVEQRQMLMDRFNADKRIFCFILSTRSGGIGVNLTGADTVVFYDSDWNPTMDAQAQDRCHRIGQTRDVHIYRLISEMTIEENILKKANQKRLLGDVAIEGGNFTEAFFKQQTIKELFEEPSGLEAFAREKQKEEELMKAAASANIVDETSRSSDGPEIKPKKAPEKDRPTRSRRSIEKKEAALVAAQEAKDGISDAQLEVALCAAEDDTDIQSVNVVKAEQKAELAEFDENIPWDEREAELKKERETELSKVEQELDLLEKELTRVERYAVQFVEKENRIYAAKELQEAEEEVTLAKEEWELSRLQALKEEEERRAELEEDEMLFTYSRDDAYSQVKKGKKNSRSNQQARSRRDRGSGISCTEGIMDREVRLVQERERSKANNVRDSKALKVKNRIEVNGDNSSVVAEGSRNQSRSAKRRSSVTSTNSEASVASSGSTKKVKVHVECTNAVETDPVSTATFEKKVEPVKNKSRKSLELTPKTQNRTPKSAINKSSLSPKKASPKKCKPNTPPKVISPKNNLLTPEPWSNPNLVIRTRRASQQSPDVKQKLDEEKSVNSNKISVLNPVVTSSPQPLVARQQNWSLAALAGNINPSSSPLSSSPTKTLHSLPSVTSSIAQQSTPIRAQNPSPSVTPAKVLTSPSTPTSQIMLIPNASSQSPAVFETRKVAAGTYVIVSQPHNALGQSIRISQAQPQYSQASNQIQFVNSQQQPFQQSNQIRYITTPPISQGQSQQLKFVTTTSTVSQQSILSGNKYVTSTSNPQSVIQRQIIAPPVNAQSPQQNTQVRPVTTPTGTNQQVILRQTPEGTKAQIVQLKQMPQDAGRATQYRTLRQITPSQLAQLRALGQIKPGQQVVRAGSQMVRALQATSVRPVQPAQGSVQIRPVLQGQTIQVRGAQPHIIQTLQPGQQIIQTSQGQRILQTLSGQQILQTLQGQQYIRTAPPKSGTAQQIVVQQPHQQLQVLSSANPAKPPVTSPQLQAIQLAQLRAVMQQARAQQQAKASASQSRAIGISGTPKNVHTVIQHSTPGHTPTQPKNTVPILEKFAMQLSGGRESILNHSPASSRGASPTVQIISRPNKVIQSRPVQVLRTSNLVPPSQVTLPANNSNTISHVTIPTSATTPVLIRPHVPNPSLVTKQNGLNG